MWSLITVYSILDPSSISSRCYHFQSTLSKLECLKFSQKRWLNIMTKFTIWTTLLQRNCTFRCVSSSMAMDRKRSWPATKMEPKWCLESPWAAWLLAAQVVTSFIRGARSWTLWTTNALSTSNAPTRTKTWDSLCRMPKVVDIFGSSASTNTHSSWITNRIMQVKWTWAYFKISQKTLTIVARICSRRTINCITHRTRIWRFPTAQPIWVWTMAANGWLPTLCWIRIQSIPGLPFKHRRSTWIFQWIRYSAAINGTHLDPMPRSLIVLKVLRA